MEQDCGGGYSRHSGETADIDAEVRNGLVGGSLRLLNENDAGDEEDKERHGERAHTGGADLLIKETTNEHNRGLVHLRTRICKRIFQHLNHHQTC